MSKFDSNLKALDIRNPIQRKAVEILSDLHGYSKRLDLLHDQVRIELGREGMGTGRINAQLTELIQLGLAKEKPGTGGIRFTLNRNIWELPTDTILLIKKTTEYLANEKRSNTLFSGLLKSVKTLIRESEALEDDLGYSIYEVLVICALRCHPDWEFDGSRIIRRYEKASAKEKTSREQVLLTLSNKPAKVVIGAVNAKETVVLKKGSGRGRSTSDTVPLPKNIEFVSIDMPSILPASIFQDFNAGSVNFFGNAAVINVPLSLGRGQRVYAVIRRNTFHEKVLWLFSICGLKDLVIPSLSDIFWHNNECVPFKVTLLDMPTGNYVGVCQTLATEGDWGRLLPNAVRNLAAFGDRLEELYWRQDDF